MIHHAPLLHSADDPLSRQSVSTMEKEALTPFAVDLPRRIQSSGNDVVRPSLGREQHELGADDVTIRCAR
jgi:hypothetical protein